MKRTLEQRCENTSDGTVSVAVAKLAQLFPGAVPVRIPVQVIAARPSGSKVEEDTLIEFRTSVEILFASALPIEFEDKLRVKNSDGSLEADATVVAVQYSEGCKTIAARFSSETNNWTAKP